MTESAPTIHQTRRVYVVSAIGPGTEMDGTSIPEIHAEFRRRYSIQDHLAIASVLVQEVAITTGEPT